MNLFGTITGIVLLMIGAIWILQGANVIGGSTMSGQSLWLYIGIVFVIVGAALIYLLRRSPR